MKIVILAILGTFLGFFLIQCAVVPNGPAEVEPDVIHLSELQVSDNGRWLETVDHKPFFWLGDTAWKLFENLDSSEVKRYFADRRAKGFTVIQAHLLTWNLSQPNIYGELPFLNGDPTQPNEQYWKYIDQVIKTGAEYGLYMAVLPMWARNYIELGRARNLEKVFLQDSIQAPYQYGHFLGTRYRSFHHLIWMLGGDEWGTRDTVYHQMAKGIVDGMGRDSFDQVLMTFHPQGGTYRPPATSTSEFYGDKAWLDFNMIQSGHRIGNRNFERIQADYLIRPAKPTLDSEPCYEQHPVLHKFENGTFSAWHLRRRAYWSVLAGACGFTYGANGLWQMSKKGKDDNTKFNYYWYEALDFEGGADMQHFRALFESRPWRSPERIPDQSIWINPADDTDMQVQIGRAADYSYWFMYSTNGSDFTIDLRAVPPITYRAWWFSPRDGKTYDAQGKLSSKPFGKITAGRVHQIAPPGMPADENDWVLVLDATEKNYRPPGQ